MTPYSLWEHSPKGVATTEEPSPLHIQTLTSLLDLALSL